MFCGKGGSSLIDKCHYRALRAIKNSSGVSYEDLLADCNVETIHARNLKLLSLEEVFKSIQHIGPSIMHDIFNTGQSAYTLRSGHTLALPLLNSSLPPD